jgi:ligand-binding sensor domain-containing protein/signal transduction histidine kinase
MLEAWAKHKRTLCLVFSFAATLALPLIVLAERLPLKTYTTADGLVRDSITRIVRDSRGFLWFCTPEGLSRFNGYEFVTYGVDQGLPYHTVNDLLEARDGTYFVATGAGLVHFKSSAQPDSTLNKSSSSAAKGALPPEITFEVYQSGDGGRAQSINALMEDRAGVIWCGTDAGLYRLEQTQGRWMLSLVNIGLPTDNRNDAMVSTFLEDRNDSLWIGTANGLYRRLRDGRVEHYTTHKGLPQDDVRALLEDQNGRLWMGTTTGLYQLLPEPTSEHAAIAQSYTVRNGLASNWITSLLHTSDGRLWVGTQAGLCEFVPSIGDAGRAFRSYTTAQGLSGSAIESLAEDGEGNLWIGTESGGAMKVARNGFASYLEADGLSSIRIASIFEDSNDELCVIGSQLGKLFINRLSNGRFTNVSPNLSEGISYGWGWNQIAFQDHTGEWWIPTDQGIFRFAGASTVDQLRRLRPKAVYTTKDGLKSNQVFRLYEDSRGDIWISTISPNTDTLARWQRATGGFQTYSAADGLPQFMAPTVFREDTNGNLWIGFYEGGIVRYQSGRFVRFTTADGVPEGMIRDLHIDYTGKLWIATSRGGVARVDELAAEHPRFVTYTTAQGLASNHVTCVIEDQQGRVYIGTPQGVDRLDPTSGHVKHYTVADGLANNFVNVAYRDRQGALWFGTLQGLSRLVPEPEASLTAPSIFISGLRIAGEAYAVSPLGDTKVVGPQLSSNQNDLQIDFFSVSVSGATSLRYQYRLEGADRDWSAPTAQRSITYAHLSPGSYSFQVRAVNVDGVTSAQPALVSFTILRPIWQRWWFVTLAALFAVAAATTLYQYRVRRLLELERVRTRIATDLHDDIGSSLSQIAILSEVVRQKVGQDHAAVTEPLSQITTSSSELMDTMSDIVWAIDPHKDRLTDLTQRMRRFASDVLTSRNIDFDFHEPDAHRNLNLGADVRRQVFLVCKESINNIARHSGCSRVYIEFRVDRDWLTLIIKDNGRGFDTVHESDGHGLLSMKQRAKETGGTLQITSRPGDGTIITLRMPISGRPKLKRIS